MTSRRKPMKLKKLLQFQQDLIRFHESGMVKLEPEKHKEFNLAVAKVNGEINQVVSDLIPF